MPGFFSLEDVIANCNQEKQDKLKKPKKNVKINIKNLAPLVLEILLSSPASQTIKFPQGLFRQFRTNQEFLDYAIKKCDVLTNSKTFKKVLKELELPNRAFEVRSP